MAEAAANGKLTLKGRYEIVMDDPLPAFDSPRAKAYSVIDSQGDRPLPLMGLLLDRRLPVRLSAMEEMRDCRLPGLLTLLDSGQTGRRGDAHRQMCLIYERPAGQAAMRPSSRFRKRRSSGRYCHAYCRC